MRRLRRLTSLGARSYSTAATRGRAVTLKRMGLLSVPKRLDSGCCRATAAATVVVNATRYRAILRTRSVVFEMTPASVCGVAAAPAPASAPVSTCEACPHRSRDHKARRIGSRSEDHASSPSSPDGEVGRCRRAVGRDSPIRGLLRRPCCCTRPEPLSSSSLPSPAWFAVSP